nr:MAG TPA: hypothetical protein [Caudoviricetes sp.]
MRGRVIERDQKSGQRGRLHTQYRRGVQLQP